MFVPKDLPNHRTNMVLHFRVASHRSLEGFKPILGEGYNQWKLPLGKLIPLPPQKNHAQGDWFGASLYDYVHPEDQVGYISFFSRGDYSWEGGGTLPQNGYKPFRNL